MGCNSTYHRQIFISSYIAKETHCRSFFSFWLFAWHKIRILLLLVFNDCLGHRELEQMEANVNFFGAGGRLGTVNLSKYRVSQGKLVFLN